jgi:hypothetical protein
MERESPESSQSMTGVDLRATSVDRTALRSLVLNYPMLPEGAMMTNSVELPIQTFRRWCLTAETQRNEPDLFRTRFVKSFTPHSQVCPPDPGER